MVLLKICCSLQQRKNFANRSRIDKVIAMVRMVQFFDSQCIWHVPTEPTSIVFRPLANTSEHQKIIQMFLNDLQQYRKCHQIKAHRLAGTKQTDRQTDNIVAIRRRYGTGP